MKKILLGFLAVFSNHSYSCEESEKFNFVQDVKVYHNQGQVCTSVQILLNEFLENENRYIESAYLNIVDSNNKLVAEVAPDMERPGFGNMLISICISESYMENSKIFLTVKPKPSVKLKGNGVLSTGSVLCSETQELVLANLVGVSGGKASGAK